MIVTLPPIGLLCRQKLLFLFLFLKCHVLNIYIRNTAFEATIRCSWLVRINRSEQTTRSAIIFFRSAEQVTLSTLQLYRLSNFRCPEPVIKNRCSLIYCMLFWSKNRLGIICNYLAVSKRGELNHKSSMLYCFSGSSSKNYNLWTLVIIIFRLVFGYLALAFGKFCNFTALSTYCLYTHDVIWLLNRS